MSEGRERLSPGARSVRPLGAAARSRNTRQAFSQCAGRAPVLTPGRGDHSRPQKANTQEHPGVHGGRSLVFHLPLFSSSPCPQLKGELPGGLSRPEPCPLLRHLQPGVVVWEHAAPSEDYTEALELGQNSQSSFFKGNVILLHQL